MKLNNGTRFLIGLLVGAALVLGSIALLKDAGAAGACNGARIECWSGPRQIVDDCAKIEDGGGLISFHGGTYRFTSTKTNNDREVTANCVIDYRE